MKVICDWKNCNKHGEYRAPVERDNSKKYRLLCLQHVKEFNKNWNYFKGMNDKEIYNFLKSDLTWHKPTQSFSSSDNFFNILWNNALKDGIKNNKYDASNSFSQNINFDNNDLKAFNILNLSVGLKWSEIQAQFKKLVKKFHPDMNAGNKKFEDKLKVITLAYTQLKNTYKNKSDAKFRS